MLAERRRRRRLRSAVAATCCRAPPQPSPVKRRCRAPSSPSPAQRCCHRRCLHSAVVAVFTAPSPLSSQRRRR
eukprot:1824657-Pleurochrysis_carterae.AAC.1